MNISKESEARELASKLGINAVPYFLYADDHGQVCTLDENGNAGKCIKEVVGNARKK